MPAPDILRMDAEALHRLRPMDIGRELTDAEITHFLRAHASFWKHSGDLEHPHVKLTSGRHSNGFVDTLRTLRFTNINQILAEHLVRRLQAQGYGPEWFTPNDIVIGSDHAGATFSYAVAMLLGTQHGFCEKVGERPNQRQVWKRFPVQPKQRVLQVEELVTTTLTLERVHDGVCEGSPGVEVEFYPIVATLVHRSKERRFREREIVYGIHYDMEDWEDNCPLCAADSEVIAPKTAENWARLTQPAT